MNKIKNEMQRRKQKGVLLRWTRIGVQILFFIFFPSIFSQAFGAVKEIIATVGKGKTITWTTFTTDLLVLCIITVIAGRIFCGWACSFGSIGDWLYQLGQFIQNKLKFKLPQIPYNIQVVLQKFKYVILLIILIMCFAGKGDYVTKNSPWTIFSLITSGSDITKYKIAIVLTVIILIGMVFKERFFCQFICPFGAIFTLIPHLPIIKLRRKSEDCIPNCTLCKRNCPVSIKLQEDEFREGECIICGRCKFGCPKNNISLKNKR